SANPVASVIFVLLACPSCLTDGATAVVAVASFATCEKLVGEEVTAGHGHHDQRTDQNWWRGEGDAAESTQHTDAEREQVTAEQPNGHGFTPSSVVVATCSTIGGRSPR